MLWANNEEEAAKRAMTKALSKDYFSSALYFLLVNLRFTRVDAAKKWYLCYLDRVDMENLGDEWQYLLQAYEDQVKRFNVRQAIDQQEISGFFEMVEKAEYAHI